MTPSVGRIVHFHSAEGPDPLASIITKVVKQPDGPLGLLSDYEVWLVVFGVGQPFNIGPCSHGEGPGQWSWPPRVS